MVRAADTHRLESAASRETWGRSHLLFQGDDVVVAREVSRQAQSQVVGLGAAVQRGAKVTPVTESPQNTQLKDGADASAAARGSASRRRRLAINDTQAESCMKTRFHLLTANS